ncbi:MAG: sigma-70 family RNA polymerase sigma factor [Gemmataceae bacterium]
MADPRTNTLLRRAARQIGRVESAAGDSELLSRLARNGDQAAFDELLVRHGPGVWALCRRSTLVEADAEDAFQATFLVLYRNAASVRRAASVGSWLYGVASRIARKARIRHERVPDPARLRSIASSDPADSISWSEVQAALDEELARLPDLLRAPILLCYFEGLTHDEAATELKWTARAVKERVARGRSLLRTRLTRRGIELPSALAAMLLTSRISSAVPVKTSAGITRGSWSPAVVALARTENTSMFAIRFALLLTTAAAVFAAGSLLGGTQEAAAPVEARATADETKPHGDVRIGSTEFRDAGGWHKRVFFIDEKTAMTVGEGPSVRYWDVETGKRIHEIALSSLYQDAAYSRTGNVLAIVGVHMPDGDRDKADTALWLIDVAARKVLRTVPMPGNHGGNSQKVQVSDDGNRVFVDYEGDVRVVDATSGDVLMRHNGRTNAGFMTVSPDGKRVAYGRNDAFLWEWQTGEPKKFTAIGGFGLYQMIFSPDGKTLYLAGNGGLVPAYEVPSGRLLRSLDFGLSPRNWAFSPDAKSLAVVHYESSRTDGRTGAVHVWDPETGKLLSKFPMGRLGASHVAWSPNGSRLAAVTDHRLWVWDVKTGQPLGPPATGHEAAVTAFAFGPDGRLFTASDDNSIRSWDPAGKPGLVLMQDHWVRGLALSADGSLLAGSALADDLRVWEAKTGREKFRLLGNGAMGGTRQVRFTPDGSRLVAWGDDLELRVWDMRNGKLLAEHRTLPIGMTEADLADPFKREMDLRLGMRASELSADGSTIAFSGNTAVQVFDVGTGKLRLKFEPEPNGVTTIAFSPDGKRLAVAGRGKHSQLPLPNGRTRFSTAPEHQTAVWDLGTQKVVWTVTAPGSWARLVRFTDDGSRLAELIDPEDKKHAIVLRDAGTGKDIGRIELPSRGSNFAFDRTGKRVAVSFWDTTAIVYDLDSALKPAKQEKP